MEKRAQVSDLTLRHELKVMDVKAALVAAITSAERFRIVEFSTWPLLCQFHSPAPTHNGFAPPEVLVKPDGLIRSREKDNDGLSEHVFFLELDRSTETQHTLALRAACYGTYYRGGGFAMRCGGERAKFAEYPFRVLMIFKNAERRNDATERMLRNSPPIHTQVWVTTFAEVTATPVGSIWVRPIDYRDVVRGSAYDVDRYEVADGYRRRPEREDLVESAVVKRTIFDCA